MISFISEDQPDKGRNALAKTPLLNLIFPYAQTSIEIRTQNYYQLYTSE